MNTGQEHNQLEDLQHEAEHTRPPKRGGAVMGYLVVLFGAAFLLLLMSYFMQQRTNREAMIFSRPPAQRYSLLKI